MVKKRAPRATSGSQAKSKSSAPSTRLPKSLNATPPALFGDKDLAYEIPDGSLRFHVQGPDSSWLPISVMPTEVRDGGLVYLQSEGKLVARSRVTGIGFRKRRWTHEAPGASSDAGPGATLDLHEDDWELISIDLGLAGEEEVQGYRYLVTLEDGSVQPAEADS